MAWQGRARRRRWFVAGAGLAVGLALWAGLAARGTPAPEAGVPLAVLAHPGLAEVLYAGTDQTLLRSTDGGGRWTPLLVGVRVTALAWAPGPDGEPGLWAGGHGFLYFSPDGGDAWLPVTTLAGPDVAGLAGAAGGLLAALSGDGRLAVSEDGGTSWRVVAPPPGDEGPRAAAAVALHPARPATLVVIDSQGVAWATHDAGRAWRPWGAPLPAPLRALAPEGAAGGWLAATGTGRLFRTRDAGDAWEPVEPAAGSGEPVAVSAGAAGTLVADLRGRLWLHRPGSGWAGLSLAARTGRGEAGRPRDPVEVRVLAISGRLRCPICAGLSVAESDTFIAVQMRRLVRELVETGRSEEEVVAYFVDRYGPEILWDPPKRGIHLWAWLAPPAALVAGSLALVYAVSSRVRRAAGDPPLPEADRDRVARALREFGSGETGRSGSGEAG